MKNLIISFILLIGVVSLAQEPTPLATIVPLVESVVAPAPQVVETPPEWLVKSLGYIYEMPVVGPYATKAMQWLGVICVILTSFTAATLASLRALSTVMTFSGLLVAASKVKSFEDSKIIYWLKYFSMFNANKKS